MVDDNPTDRIIPYIKKFMVVHPYAGVYTVDDSKYESSASKPEKKHFHPSGDCLKCQRLMFFERQSKYVGQLVDDITPELQVIFKTGDAFHAMIQAWFTAMTELDGFPDCIGNEVRIDNKDFNVGAFMDSVLRMPGMDEDIVIEIKSINSYQFGKLNGPRAEHRLQLGSYLLFTGAPFGIVLYINKDTGEMKEFKVEPVDMGNVLMRWENVGKAVKEKDASHLHFECKKGDSQWSRCPARNICFRC